MPLPILYNSFATRTTAGQRCGAAAKRAAIVEFRSDEEFLPKTMPDI
jgi:hypothetical protein